MPWQVELHDTYGCTAHVAAWNKAFPGTKRKPDIPLLEHGEIMIDGIGAVIYIAEALDGPDLIPKSPLRKGFNHDVYMAFIDNLGRHGVGGVHKCLQASNVRELKEAIKQTIKGLTRMNDVLKEKALDGGPFTEGPDFSFVECIAAPWLLRMYIALPHWRKVDPLELADDAGLDRVAQWFRAMLERPSVKSTAPPLGVKDIVRVWGNTVPVWDTPDGTAPEGVYEKPLSHTERMALFRPVEKPAGG